jgi:hypothetical protein
VTGNLSNPFASRQTLFAYLALTVGTTRREKLAGLLWPDSSEKALVIIFVMGCGNFERQLNPSSKENLLHTSPDDIHVISIPVTIHTRYGDA